MATVLAGSPPANYQTLVAEINKIRADVAAIHTKVAAIITDLNAHVHTGVTVGAGSSGAKDTAAVTAQAALTSAAMTMPTNENG